MIVKYYGYNETVNGIDRSAIEIFRYTTDIYPSEGVVKIVNDLRPSYCIWLVPGTFDSEGMNIPIEPMT